MAQVRKPIPKTPAEHVQDAIVPYDLAGYDKTPPVKEIRANKVSVKGSRDKDFSVKLIDLDTAVLEHIKNNIKPTVYQNTEIVDVPVIYAFPERWVAVQKDGYLRDGNGKIMTPLIVVNRTDFTKNRTVSRNLDSNFAQNVHVFQKTYTSKNAYDNFAILNNRMPVKEMTMVAHPDYVTITYDLMIFTNFVEQLNRIQEALQYAENSYWGDKNRYYFRVNIDSFSTVNSYTKDDDRTVSSKATITLHGYLIPDTINAFLSHDMSYVTKGQIVFNEQTVSSTGKKPAVQQRISVSSNDNGSFTPSPAVSNYLNTNSSRQATYVNQELANLQGSYILPAPPPLPPTSEVNFTIFINGINVDYRYFDIEQRGSSIRILFDTAGMGYTLQSVDDILVVGKFI